MDIGTDSWHCCVSCARMKVLSGTCKLQHIYVFRIQHQGKESVWTHTSRTMFQQHMNGTQLHLIIQNPSGITIWLQSDIGGSIEPLLQLVVLRIVASQAAPCIAVYNMQHLQC